MENDGNFINIINIKPKVVDQQEVLKSLFQKQEVICINDDNESELINEISKEAKHAAKIESERRKEEKRKKFEDLRIERKLIDEEYRKKLDENRIKRLEYLEKQTKLYTHFVNNDDNNNNGPPQKTKNVRKNKDDSKTIVKYTSSPKFINGTMRNYQVDGLNWMISMYNHGINGILADEMGLGKTLQTIALLGHMTLKMKLKSPHLVIVPLSTLNNWMNEFKRWCPSLRVIKYHDSNKDLRNFLTQKLKKPKLDYDVILTTYQIPIIERTTIMRICYSYVVIDEAHICKNEETQLSTILRQIHKTNILLLTGTPLHNTTHELWALLNLLQPEFFNSAGDFDAWFEDEECRENDILAKKLKDILKPFMLRRIKSDVEKGIPPKKYFNVYLPITPLQKLYTQKLLDKDVEYMTASGEMKRKTINNSFAHLKKVTNHPFLIEGCEYDVTGIMNAPTTEHLIKHSSKLIALDKLLPRFKEQGSRVLIFCQQIIMLDILDDYFQWKGYKYCRLTGDTASDERQSLMDEFNDPKSDIFIFMITTRAGGQGINLTAADVVIFYDMDWNPQMDIQAEDRAHRIGQTKQVRIYRLIVKDTIDVSIFKIAEKKKKLDNVIIQRSLTKDEMDKIIQYQTARVNLAETSEEVISDADIDKLVNQKISDDTNVDFHRPDDDFYESPKKNVQKRQREEYCDYEMATRKRSRKN